MHAADLGYNNDYYQGGKPSLFNQRMIPTILSILEDLAVSPPAKVFDLGSGAGHLASALTKRGFSVTGVDISDAAVRLANESYPNLAIKQGDIYDDLAAEHGTFPLLIGIEVIEHCHLPCLFGSKIFDLMEPNGMGILTTPFHGYAKNLALALSGKAEKHFCPLWDGGHVKFYSETMLRKLLQQSGFVDIHFRRFGRFGPFAESMIAMFKKPGQGA